MDKKIEDLPPKEPTADEVEQVKGGARKLHGNDEDDDLEDLEIQR